MEELTPAQYPVIDLFPDDTHAEEAPMPAVPTVTEYRRAFRAIKWYRQITDTADTDEDRVLEQLKRETDNVKAFYENKRKQAKERIALWLRQLDAMMQVNGVRKMATPYGTSFYAEGKKKTWNAGDEELLAFAKQTGEKDLVTTKEYPNKKQIEEYINASGKGTDLLTITTGPEVRVRIASEG
jgi:hypothetical protein